jgi:trehalose/maltose hydrolase-like predicted phosphorylase
LRKALRWTREHELESLFAIGNGYVGSRGSLAEGSPLSAPATFLAGVFDAAVGAVPELAPMADWTRLSAAIDRRPLRLDRGRTPEHRRILDMRQGMLWREWRHQDEVGRITLVRGLRLASLADRHLLMQCITITPENYSGHVFIDAAMIGPVTKVTGNGTTVAMAVASRIVDRSGRWTPSADLIEGRESLQISQGGTYRLDRVVAVHSSRETKEPREATRKHVGRAVEAMDRVIEEHRDAWLARWQESDVRLDGDPAAQRALRFAIYHLTSVANPQDDRVSIGARGLSGTSYKGHVFWDTDIFMLPFFTLTYPEAARALVMYRFHTLPAARARAAKLGYQGALPAFRTGAGGAVAVAAGRSRPLSWLRREDWPVRAVPRLFRSGGDRPLHICSANRRDGSSARPRAHTALKGGQATRCRHADLSALGSHSPRRSGGPISTTMRRDADMAAR